jgi:hypothetical protein
MSRKEIITRISKFIKSYLTFAGAMILNEYLRR